HRDGVLLWPARGDVERVLGPASSGNAGDAKDELAAVFDCVDAKIEVSHVGCPAQHTERLGRRLPVPAAENDRSGTAELRLATPRQLLSWASVSRPWSPWMTTLHGE